MVKVRRNALPRELFLREIVTRLPLTVTAARIVSPGRTVILMWRAGAGRSSYQAEYLAPPCATQSKSVPVCSSAPEVRLNPPMPTQVDEWPRWALSQLPCGTTHVAETDVNLVAAVFGVTT